MDTPFPAGMLANIEKILAEDNLYPCSCDYYPHVFNSDLFFPLQRINELQEMIHLVRLEEPVTVMEIGADKGGSLYHWIKCILSVRHIIACEVRGLPYASLFEKTFPHINFVWLEGSSYSPDVYNRLAEEILQPINVLFIDGDKSKFDVDFNTYLPFMSLNGVIFLHDINDSPTSNSRQTFERARRKGYRTHYILDTSEVEPALSRERLGIPPASPYEAWLRYWQGRSCGVGVVYLDGRKDEI